MLICKCGKYVTKQYSTFRSRKKNKMKLIPCLKIIDIAYKNRFDQYLSILSEHSHMLLHSPLILHRTFKRIWIQSMPGGNIIEKEHFVALYVHIKLNWEWRQSKGWSFVAVIASHQSMARVILGNWFDFPAWNIRTQTNHLRIDPDT